MLAIKSMCAPGGGAERVLADLANFLIENQLEVHLMTFDAPNSQSFYRLAEQVLWHGLRIGNPLEKTTLMETVNRVIAMRSVIQKQRPDVVVGFMHSMYIPLSISLIGMGIPVIGSEHIVSEHYQTRQLEYALLTLSTFFIKRFTVLSDRIRRSYPWIFRRKAIAIPNPVIVASLRRVPKVKGDRKIVLSVGRLEAQKDQLTLIRAFGRIAAQFPEWDLRVPGEGSLRFDLEGEVDALGLAWRISLPGSISEIAAEYATADLFVLPSLYESFGLATAEAMSHGIPVIGFADCPGTNELIQDGVNGILVESSDRVGSLARAMTMLMKDELLRKTLGTQAKLSVERFAPEKIFGRWLEILEDVVREY